MVKREEFNIFAWSSTVPLCEDVYLGMQLRNIAIVDIGLLRDIEQQALESYFRDDRPDGETLMLLSATSQERRLMCNLNRPNRGIIHLAARL